MKEKILIDNNILNILNTEVQVFEGLSSKYDFYVCSTVIEELANMPDAKKEERVRLLLSFAKMGIRFVTDAVFIIGHNRLDCSRIPSDKASEVYNSLLNESSKNVKDAIIATTAVVDGCILLTDDKKLKNKMKQLQYRVMSFEEFKNDENGAEKE
ncbi:MAG: hypothetical protein FWF59_05770 [Turicibacter sp.]|nr:hypothetical protein [Turicibacter sp.]